MNHKDSSLARRLAVALPAGALLLSFGGITAPTASAAALSPCVVKSAGTTYSDLQTAINASSPETTLLMSGTCRGTFASFPRSLTLAGAPGSILEAAVGQPALDVYGGMLIRGMTIIGGIHLNYTSVTLDQSSVSYMSVPSDSTARIVDSTVTGGSSQGGGYGAGVDNSGTTSVLRSTLSYDSAYGIQNSGSMKVTDSTIFGNLMTADYDSGGVLNTAGKLRIIGSTITGNTNIEGSAGGINNEGGIVTVTASILAANQGGCYGTIMSGGYNVTDGCLPASGTDIFSASNVVVPVAGNFGGPTDTAPPLLGSPAIDAIPTGATGLSGVPLCPSTGGLDQRGMPRLVGPRCDVGAVEGTTASAATVPLAFTVVGPNSGRSCSPGASTPTISHPIRPRRQSRSTPSYLW